MVVPRRVLAEASPGRLQATRRRPALAEAGRRVVPRDSLPSLEDGGFLLWSAAPGSPVGCARAGDRGQDEMSTISKERDETAGPTAGTAGLAVLDRVDDRVEPAGREL